MREPTNSKESSQGPRPEAPAAEVESTEEWEAETPEGRAGWEGDSEELPACDDETKVVLLPVNPYLVHVYWGIAARDLKEIGRVFSRLGPRAQPVLRFYDVTQASTEGRNPQCWYEVEIALGAGNWYVHLERPAKSYYIDLGLRIAGGGFHRLARSNVAETPRAGPSDKLEESYLLVKGDYSPLETVGQERLGASRSVSTIGERQSGEAKGLELGAGSPYGREPSGPRLPKGFGPQAGEGLRGGPAYSKAQGGEANGLELGAGSLYGPEPSGLRLPKGFGPQAGEGLRGGPAYSDAQGGEAKGLELGAGSLYGLEPSGLRLPKGFGPQAGEGLRGGPIYSEAQGGETKGWEEGTGSPYGLKFLDDGSPSAPTYGEPAEIEPELTEISQLGEWEPHGVTPQASGTGEPQPSGEEAVDLTDLNERSFRAGLSSGQKSL